MKSAFEFIFWFSIVALGYTFLGYRVVIGLLAKLRPAPAPGPGASYRPDICAVVVAYNEEMRIVTRVENLLASDYPVEKLRVLIISDGSTDGTVARLQNLANPRVEVLALPSRQGKAAGLNAAMEKISAELVVLTDARQEFTAETIALLSRHFADPKIGAVSGSLEIRSAQSNTGQGIDAYWKLEKAIRAAEARWDSCIGCTGAVYAIRRACYVPIPEDTVLDDVVIPMQIALQGRRVLHDPAAIAIDPQPLEPAAERLRKRRTLAGNFQMLFRYPRWLLPWHSRLWWQLISHKYLRLVAPLWLLLAFVANGFLVASLFYRILWIGHNALYTCALLGIFCPRLTGRLFSFPAGFVFLNFTTLNAFLQYLRSPDLHRWQAAKPASDSVGSV